MYARLEMIIYPNRRRNLHCMPQSSWLGRSKMLLMKVLCVCCVLSLSAASLRWRKVNVSGISPPRLRDFGSGFWVNEAGGDRFLVVFGGRRTDGARINETWLFDVDRETWMRVSVSPETRPPRRYSFVSGVVQSHSLFVVAMGQGPAPSDGIYSTNDRVKYNDVWALDLKAMRWTMLNVQGDGISRRYGGHGGVFFNSTRFYVGGGLADDHRRYSDTFQIDFNAYNATSPTSSRLRWEVVHPGAAHFNQYTPAVPHARCLHASTLASENDLVIFGGCLSGGRAGGPCPSQDSWHLSVTEGKWRQLPFCSAGRAWSAMAPLTALDGGIVVLFGGIDAMNRQTLALERYPLEELLVANLSAQSWTRLRAIADPIHGYPARREGHAMVATDDGRIYMFGGRDIYSNIYYNDVWELSGNLSDSESVGSCHVLWFTWLHLHGLINSLAWGFVLPLGVLVARYYRKKDSKAWFWAHRILQITGLTMAIAAVVMVAAVSSTPTFPHAILGILLLLMAFQQPINGFLRPHKEKRGDEKKKRRACWEAWHKTVGYLTVVLGLTNSTLGTLLIIAPKVVWVLFIVVVVLWVAVFAVHEAVRLCQAYRASAEVKRVKEELLSLSNITSECKSPTESEKRDED